MVCRMCCSNLLQRCSSTHTHVGGEPALETCPLMRGRALYFKQTYCAEEISGENSARANLISSILPARPTNANASNSRPKNTQSIKKTRILCFVNSILIRHMLDSADLSIENQGVSRCNCLQSGWPKSFCSAVGKANVEFANRQHTLSGFIPTMPEADNNVVFVCIHKKLSISRKTTGHWRNSVNCSD